MTIASCSQLAQLRPRGAGKYNAACIPHSWKMESQSRHHLSVAITATSMCQQDRTLCIVQSCGQMFTDSRCQMSKPSSYCAIKAKLYCTPNKSSRLHPLHCAAARRMVMRPQGAARKLLSYRSSYCAPKSFRLAHPPQCHPRRTPLNSTIHLPPTKSNFTIVCRIR